MYSISRLLSNHDLETKNMKRYICVQVDHHKNVGSTIEAYQAKGWQLHTYQAAQRADHSINHYLLFESAQEFQPKDTWPQGFYSTDA